MNQVDPMMSILIAEDDRSVRESLTRALQLEGYGVIAVGDGVEALRAVRTQRPDVLLLDVAMPEVDGFAVAKRLRDESNRIPILMLTARTELGDRITGLDMGADDYLPKPYRLDELLARVRALLRRASFSEGFAPPDLTVGSLRLDVAGRRAFRGGHELELSKTEFDLLELLAMNVGIVLSHATIYERIWNYEFDPDSKNLAVYIGYLRRKSEQHDEPRLIHTVRGSGYVVQTARP